MSTFWERVQGIQQQQNAAAMAAQDAAIQRGSDFWRRVDGIQQQQNAAAMAAQDAAIHRGSDFWRTVDDLRSDFSFDFLDGIPGLKPASSNTSAVGVSRSVLKPSTFDYINADIAKQYGMSKSTAYQEALSNTAYQRAVADMKSAGLNPAVLYGAGRAGAASSTVYGASDGSSGYVSSGRYSGSGKSDKLFSSSAYSAIQAIGGLIGLAASKRPDGFWIGSQTAKGAMALLDAVSGK